jgi:TP901 family phage tail tape measure protein
MGDAIQTTSKLMGNDGTAAAEVLTTAMNQYGVSLADPMEASRKMAEMMNVMAAAGQAGSAELPAIKAALEQCGMASKAANVSFEETNAAIQVLDKAGKKGSEGGVALRNTLSILSQGRFLPKDTREELERAGIDVLALGDKSKSLKERLELLKPVLNDSALFSKLFGMENANAARALVQGTEQLGQFTKAVTGTNSAEEQAATVMESTAEKRARFRQQIEDLKISFTQLTGGFTAYIGVLAGVLVPISQVMPAIMGMGTAIKWVVGLKYATYLRNVATMARTAAISITLMGSRTALANGISLGFIGNIGRCTIALLRFSTAGIWSGIKALGAFLLSLITTGGASATFAGIASVSFGAFKLSAVSACRAVSIAIMNIPIIGWIAAAIAALIAVGVYFWNTSVKFRAVLKGLWAAFKAVFSGIGNLAKQTFGAIGDLIKAAFKLDAGGITAALNKLKGAYGDYGKEVGKAFNDAYTAEMKAGEKSNAKKSTKKQGKSAATAGVTIPEVPTPTVPDVTSGTAGATASKKTGGSSDSGGKIKNVSIHVDKLVERLEIHTANLQESAERVKDVVAQALLSALNDTNLAME